MYCERTLGRPITDDDLERFDWCILHDNIPSNRLVSGIWVRILMAERPR